MLKKIIAIENVGKFRSFHAAGDIELRKLNLIYAENGRGKTTLCDILRSLQTGDGQFIQGRETIGVSDRPGITIRLENDTAQFKDGQWNTALPEIAVFDSTFIHENVYAGDYIDHDHKRNLYRVIIGEEGVKLAKQVDTLDVEIRDANRELS